jgi:hypothetical protein
MNDALLKETLILLLKTARDHHVQIGIMLRNLEVQADFSRIRDEHSTDADLDAVEKKAAEIVESHGRKLDELVESGDELTRKVDELLRVLTS